MPRKCSFQDCWLKDSAYQEWILRDKLDKHYTRCMAMQNLAHFLCSLLQPWSLQNLILVFIRSLFGSSPSPFAVFNDVSVFVCVWRERERCLCVCVGGGVHTHTHTHTHHFFQWSLGKQFATTTKETKKQQHIFSVTIRVTVMNRHTHTYYNSLFFCDICGSNLICTTKTSGTVPQ